MSFDFQLLGDMDKIQLLKRLFEIFAFGIFVFQMQNSLRKYEDNPTVQQTSTVHFDDIHKPMMFVCQVIKFQT